MSGCGACNLCCTLLHIPDMGKPPGMTCWHTTIHGGCKVHAEKAIDPQLQACHQFKCVWLASQDHEDESKRGTRAMRPDQIHVVLGPYDRNDPTLVYVHVDPAYKDAWNQPSVRAYMDEQAKKGAKFCVVIGDRHFMYESREGAFDGDQP